MITNFQSQNVRSPLILKQERSQHRVYANETTRAYICYRKTISTQKVAERCKNVRIKFTKLRLNQTLDARAI